MRRKAAADVNVTTPMAKILACDGRSAQRCAGSSSVPHAVAAARQQLQAAPDCGFAVTTGRWPGMRLDNNCRSQMWVRLNTGLKRILPSAHASLKRGFAKWQSDADPLVPAPRRIRGQFFWVHPRLLATETRDTEPHIYRWIVDHLSAGGVFFDVGSNYGWLSLSVCRHVGPSGRVVAFEPSPVLFETLQYHQRRNRLRQMIAISSAVAETDTAVMDFYLLNGGLSSRNSLTIGRPGLPFLDSDKTTITQVPTVKLDSFCKAQGLIPDVIKIDVEGAEGMVLRGAASILRQYGPTLVLSTHPYWLPDSESTEAIFGMIFEYGYRIKDSRVVQFGAYEIGDYLLVT